MPNTGASLSLLGFPGPPETKIILRFLQILMDGHTYLTIISLLFFILEF